MNLMIPNMNLMIPINHFLNQHEWKMIPKKNQPETNKVGPYQL